MEINKLIEELVDKSGDNIYDLLEDLEEGRSELFGSTKLVDYCGDEEGGGEYSMKVFHFEDFNLFVKITGFYSSYNGFDWNDDWKQVFPKEKQITVYE